MALERHAKRARYAEWSIALLYATVVVFVITCISIAVDHAACSQRGRRPERGLGLVEAIGHPAVGAARRRARLRLRARVIEAPAVPPR
jgi:hypothetical protein